MSGRIPYFARLAEPAAGASPSLLPQRRPFAEPLPAPGDRLSPVSERLRSTPPATAAGEPVAGPNRWRTADPASSTRAPSTAARASGLTEPAGGLTERAGGLTERAGGLTELASGPTRLAGPDDRATSAAGSPGDAGVPRWPASSLRPAGNAGGAEGAAAAPAPSAAALTDRYPAAGARGQTPARGRHGREQDPAPGAPVSTGEPIRPVSSQDLSRSGPTRLAARPGGSERPSGPGDPATDGSGAAAGHRTGQLSAVPAAPPLTGRSVMAPRHAPEGPPPPAAGITDHARPAELTIGTIEVTVINGTEQTDASPAAAARAAAAQAAQAARAAQMARPPTPATPTAAGLSLAARRWYGMAQT